MAKSTTSKTKGATRAAKSEEKPATTRITVAIDRKTWARFRIACLEAEERTGEARAPSRTVATLIERAAHGGIDW